MSDDYNVGGVEIQGYTDREAPTPASTIPYKTFGTIGEELPTYASAFSGLKQKYRVCSHVADTVLSNQVLEVPGPRFPKNTLSQLPVDLLLVGRGSLTDNKCPSQQCSRWLQMIQAQPAGDRPKVVVESWHGNAVLWEGGPADKLTITKWEKAGYVTRCRLLHAADAGGAIDQAHFLVVRHLKEHITHWSWDVTGEGQVSRSMSNLLVPPGLVPRSAYKGSPQAGETIWGPDDMMPDYNGWVQTSNREPRRLLLEEWGRGLGLEKRQITELKGPLTHSKLRCSTAGSIWEYIGSTLTNMWKDTHFSQGSSRTDNLGYWAAPPAAQPRPYHWAPPNLEKNGKWYQDRILSLRGACESAPTLEARHKWYTDGLTILDIHRENYTPTHPEPKRLQLIWWEFPCEHWEPLREGSRMNFMRAPESRMEPNSKMTPEESKVAAAFVDELLDLNVLLTPPEDDPVVATCPLFTLEKPGQPGQFRCIADMKKGGQNLTICNDPVQLPRTFLILDAMYTGGFSAVVDVSKMFYQFPTHPDDRRYLGLQHPLTGGMYQYGGLPMGAGNSPGLAGRYGLSFLRLLKETTDIFGQSGRDNCYWTEFRDTGTFVPGLGYGYILTRSDGRPAVLIWVWVDDFLIHGPDWESTAEALTFFLDASVRVGMLCHPGKLIPPQQIVKYCGFLFDTKGTPTLRIPEAKREKALAMVQHVLLSPADHLFSRLALSVVAGVLESLTEATPDKIGHTYLRAFHNDVHPEGSGTGAAPYYGTSRVPEASRIGLRWWANALHSLSTGRQARTPRAGVLVPTWGDGSGTGTGGTAHLPGLQLEMWMGAWSKQVVVHESSNWKELRTLDLTVERILTDPFKRKAVEGTTFFYFTDNMVTYYIAQAGSSSKPGLHVLIERIKLNIMKLRCQLEVVHVPGKMMICQGTDGLSRGVWMSAAQNLRDQGQLLAHIFSPLPYTPDLLFRYLDEVGATHQEWRYQDWTLQWETRPLFDCLTAWFPPPEVAAQAISFQLEAWVERPTTTSALFFVPRIMQGRWKHLSRHIVELTPFVPWEEPWIPTNLSIPVIVLYLPRFVRQLSPSPPDGGMEPPATRAEILWHQQQAAHVRGLQGTSVEGPKDPEV